MVIADSVSDKKLRHRLNYMKLRCGDYVPIDNTGEGIVTNTYLTKVQLFIRKPTYDCEARSRVKLSYSRITGRLQYELSNSSEWGLFDFVEKSGSVYCISWKSNVCGNYHGVLVDTTDK